MDAMDMEAGSEEVGGEGGASEVAPEILSEALEQGWVPQDKWTGRPEEWSDAETFVRRGREINPILRKALKKERERTAALESQLRSTGATVAELREYLAKVEERATKNALAQLKKARSEALASGDHEAAASYEEQMDELKEAPSAVPAAAQAPASQQLHPDVITWMKQNPWYSEDNPEMVEYANGATINLMQRRQNSGQAIVPSEVLDEMTARVKKMFPQYFSRGESAPASMFEGGGSRSGSAAEARESKGKTGFSSLPKSAQAQFQRFYEAGYYVDLKTNKKLSLDQAQAEYFKEYQ